MSQFFSRRQLLRDSACGFGSLALAAICSEQSGAAGNPLLSKTPHFTPRAKRVIFMFMQGGPSQMETFDYKPRLNAEHGKPVPFDRDENVEQGGIDAMRLFGSGWKFRPCGQAGIQVSELFPEVGKKIDEICVLNGMQADSLAHAPAVCNYIRATRILFDRRWELGSLMVWERTIETCRDSLRLHLPCLVMLVIRSFLVVVFCRRFIKVRRLACRTRVP